MTLREQTEQRERETLSSRACLAEQTRGRARPEEPCGVRTCFQVDTDRIVYCKSFRRLKHKTQVFLQPEGDHYRTRMTHTLEVSRIARTIARGLALNEDLTEAIALGHDLGHTPFGHAGERVLNELMPGGFAHFRQSVRVVERLEKNWRALVTEEDTVVIAGDISWGMRLEETGKDFAFIESLPGKKLLLKGNHDYWWSTRNKIETFFAQKGFKTMQLVFNSAERVGDITVCGTRGWLYNAETAEDKKIVARENGRLIASLNAAKALGGTPVVFLHYPPAYDTAQCRELLDTMQAYGVKECYYGHIHGDHAAKKAPLGEYGGIKMHLVSCDYIRFTPKLVRKDAEIG